jgi:8-oxo-dGTP diphosphatase
MSQPDYVRWLRDRIGPVKTILAYSSAIISDHHGQILLQHRYDFPWWGLPGGIIERGEHLSECLTRETREETGLHVTPRQLVGVYSSPDFDVTYPNGDQVQQFTICFACQVTGGTLRPDGEEILNLDYFPPDDLPEVPSWYQAMIADFAAGHPEPSFRQGRPGAPSSRDHILWIRQLVGKDPLIITGASASIFDDSGRLLLVRRVDDGQWTLPAGGMELGERIDQAIIREVREETGLEVEPERLSGVYSGPDSSHTYPHGDQIYIIAANFVCRITGGDPRADGHETADVRFFPLDALPPIPRRHRVRIDDVLTGSQMAAWS